jgi:hypothetical protein
MAYGVYLADSIDHTELKTDSVRSAEIQASAVEAAEIASDAVTTAKILDDNVTNDKLANIARGSIKVGGASDAPTDLVAKAAGQIIVGDGTDVASVAVSGDATLAANGALTVADEAITYAKMQHVSATARILGRNSGGAGDVEEVTPAQLMAMFNSDLGGNFTIGNQSSDSATFTGGLIVAGDLTVQGTTTQVDTTNLQVKDKNILINDGGANAASTRGAGLDIEHGGSGSPAVEGFIRVGASDESLFELKAPGNAGVFTLDINASKTMTVAGALNVAADSAINQDVQSTASPSFAGLSLAAGAADILIQDNNAAALEIKEGSNAYITVNTTNSSEHVAFGKDVKLSNNLEYVNSGRLLMVDNDANALSINEGSNTYMKFVTTNSGEKVQMFKGIDFATAGENALTIPDNEGDALTIKEGGNFYMKFVTTNSGEKVQMFKGIDFATAGENALTIPDNQADALTIKEGANFYMKFVTTNSGEKIDAMKGFGVMRYCKQAVTADGSIQGDAVAIAAGKALALITSDGAAKGVKLPQASACEEGEYILVASAADATAAFKLYAEDAAGKISGVDSVNVPVGGSVGCVLIDKANKKWILV